MAGPVPGGTTTLTTQAARKSLIAVFCHLLRREAADRGETWIAEARTYAPPFGPRDPETAFIAHAREHGIICRAMKPGNGLWRPEAPAAHPSSTGPHPRSPRSATNTAGDEPEARTPPNFMDGGMRRSELAQVLEDLPFHPRTRVAHVEIDADVAIFLSRLLRGAS